MIPTVFIAGTDTGVGKTYATCAIAQSLRAGRVQVGIYKPACSGAVAGSDRPVWDDVEQAFRALEGEYDRRLICPQTFLAPLAPPVAAAREGATVDEQMIQQGFDDWHQVLEPFGEKLLLVEGAGGWLSPLSEHWTCAEIAEQWNTPVLLIASQKLGVINHTLLTLESIRSRGLPVLGVVLNSVSSCVDESAESNAEEIRRRGQVAVVASIDHAGPVPESVLQVLLELAGRTSQDSLD